MLAGTTRLAGGWGRHRAVAILKFRDSLNATLANRYETRLVKPLDSTVVARSPEQLNGLSTCDEVSEATELTRSAGVRATLRGLL